MCFVLPIKHAINNRDIMWGLSLSDLVSQVKFGGGIYLSSFVN